MDGRPDLRLRCAQALVDGALRGPLDLILRAGRIHSVEPVPDGPTASRGAAPDRPMIALGDGTLTAGLVDLQNNGSFGIDVAAADADGWLSYRAALAAAGVTAVQPTVISSPENTLHAVVRRYQAAADHVRPGLSRLVGLHAEGPFLSVRHPGMHPPVHLTHPTAEAVGRLLDGPGRAALRTVTLAPELPGALAAIRRLHAAGIVVAVGHTDADAAVTAAAANAGASMATHVFNAMRPLHHRDPGAVGQVLTDSRFTVGLVADGLHVDPVTAAVVLQAAAGRVALVTDAVVTAGLGPGAEGSFGGTPVRADDAGAARTLNGTLAGAGITLSEGVRRLVAAGLDAATVLHAATAVPAGSVGRPDLGVLRPGACADLVWWAPDWTVRQVWLDGVALDPGPRVLPDQLAGTT